MTGASAARAALQPPPRAFKYPSKLPFLSPDGKYSREVHPEASMSQTTHYMAIPAGVVDFAEKHPDILELLGAWAGRRPVLRDLPQLLREAEEDRSILGDYGRLTLATLRAFAASPHTELLATLVPPLGIDKAGPGIHF